MVRVHDELKVPDGSIYFWMFNQGLKHVPLDAIEVACRMRGKEIRPKDEENYWNGYYRSDLYLGHGKDDVFKLTKSHRGMHVQSIEFLTTPYHEYPEHPYLGMPEIEKRFVPCNKDNKPMIKWGNGCMDLSDALAVMGQVYLAENLKGCKFIVIDCDGDHDEELDTETIAFLYRFSNITHMMSKPKLINQYEGYEDTKCTVPASFHLSFMVDRVIPTMHFPWANIDIVGNRANSLRYFKNKVWNGLPPTLMTDELWSRFQEYIKYRKEKANATRRDELAGHADEEGVAAGDDQAGVREDHA